MDYRARRKKLTEAMERLRLDGLLVTHLPNVRYLCGFTGSAGVLALAGSRAAFCTDGRYREQARSEVVGARVVVEKRAAVLAAQAWLEKQGARRVGFEAEHTPVATRQRLGESLGRKTRLAPTSGLVERLRMVKEREEIEQIRAAVVLASGLFDHVLQTIRPGAREADVAADLEHQARRDGAEGMSFETIVAAGKRAALPHGRASAQPIPRDGFVILDFGVILAGYCSDMTRTVYVGRPGKRERELYGAVLAAQEAAIAKVMPGRAVSEVDQAARSVLRKAGLARYFTHSTGHGVGLEIHEPPRLAKGQNELLQPGMVITIEPGVYLPGYGGVRIEDVVVVTPEGCEVLTPTTKELVARE